MDNSLTVLDLIVMIFVAYMSFLGLKKGLLLIVIELAGLLMSIFIAVSYYLPVEAFLSRVLGVSPPYGAMVSFVGVWGLSFFAFYKLGQFFQRQLTQAFFVGPINTIGGGILGAFRGLAMLIPFLLPFSYTNLPLYQDSKVAKPLNRFAKRYLNGSQKTQAFLKGVDSKRQIHKDLKKDPELLQIQKLLNKTGG